MAKHYGLPVPCLSVPSQLSVLHPCLTANQAKTKPSTLHPRTPPLLVLGILGWMKWWLGWHLVCPGRWQGLAGQDQPDPGSAEGKKSFLATTLDSP